MDNPDDLLTAAEVAQIMHSPVSTLRYWRAGSGLDLATGLIDEVDPPVGAYGLRGPSHGDTILISL
jgi:hypothetical protein